VRTGGHRPVRLKPLKEFAMIRMLLAVATCLAMVSVAVAADIPRPQPPPPTPPVGKAPVGKYPVGKFPVGKFPGKYPQPQPVVTKG
jgi:hypothetical protein